MSKTESDSAPLTIDLTHSLLNKVKGLQNRFKIRSLSALMRFALEQYDFGHYRSDRDKHHQISIRLPLGLKSKLHTLSKSKGVSIGELIRVAITELCSQPPKNQTINTMVAKKKAKKATKKTAKKATKKTAKRR